MRIILLVSFIFTLQISFASQFLPLILSDSTNPKAEFKLNKKEFLEKYGKDDSSRALINYFFLKRRIGKIGIFNNADFVSFFSVATLQTIPSISQSKTSGGFAILIYILLAMTSTVLMFAIILLIKYSRKKLLGQLNNYNIGEGIPKIIARSQLYKRLLKNEKKM